MGLPGLLHFRAKTVAADDVHRLRDILVEEVSLVDRAANKRRFLLVKREGDMSELRADGRGGFSRVHKADGDDEPEDETEKGKKKPPPFAGAKPPFGGKPKPGDDDEDEEKRRKAAADEEDAEKRRKAKYEEEEEEEKRRQAAKGAGGAALSSKVSEIVDDLQDLAEKLDDDDEPSDVNMKKLLAAHKKLGGMAEAYMKRTAKKSVEIAKIGAKMSASRLAMFKESLATLQSLLTELMDSPKKEKDHAPDPGDPQAAAPGWKPANPSGAPGNASGAAAIKAVQKSFNDLLGLVENQQQTIVRLGKGITPSNALAVDGRHKGGGAEVVWPMDVNARPRDTKDVSFLDE